MEDPVAGLARNPGGGDGLAGQQLLGHHPVALGPFRVDLVAKAVAAAVDAEVEPMQMQRVVFHRGVDPAPFDRFALGIGEPRVGRPGAAVDDGERRREDRRAIGPIGVEPFGDDEDLFLGIGPGASGIDDDRTGELGIDTHPRRHRLVAARAPIVVGAGRAQLEADLAGLAGSEGLNGVPPAGRS